MASVFKRGRWVDGNGRKCRKDKPGARWHESRYYTAQVFIDGKPKLVKGYTDKQASEQLGAKLERAKAQGEQGLVDPYKPTGSARWRNTSPTGRRSCARLVATTCTSLRAGRGWHG